MPDSIDSYAAGILEIARAEGQLDRVSDELFRVSRSFEASSELREALTDARVPADRKAGIVGDLLGEASPLVASLVNLVVSMGRATDLPGIADGVAARAAAERDKAVAEVRAAVELDADTVGRLEAALGRSTGKQVEVKAVVDPSVLGGVIAQIGDTVIDGSLRTRLDSLRQSLDK